MNKERHGLNQIANRRRHNFLIDVFFEDIPGYGTKGIKDWVLVKHVNGNTGDYEVSIFTKENYKKSEEGYRKFGLFSNPK